TALLTSLYERYPSLRTLATTQKNSPATTDPRHLTSLLETPWVRLLNRDAGFSAPSPAQAADMKAKSWKRLLLFQQDSGGFSWFPNGAASALSTLRVLWELSLAKRRGLEIDTAVTQ